MTNFEYEDDYGDVVIAGVDEAGRGALAGPVVAAAVIVDREFYIDGIKDSKKLSKLKREKLYKQITSKYIHSVGIISPEIIDEINILQATKKACIAAIGNLFTKPDVILIDGNMKFNDEIKSISKPTSHYRSIIKGDDKSYSIAAASIVAKVTRDNIMKNIAKEYPHYLWENNFGYGTEIHINAIKKHNITQHHRKSFLKSINFSYKLY